MRKLSASLFILIASASALFAAWIPISDYDERTVFSSPALLASLDDRSIPFGIELKGYADMDMLNFISNPASVLQDAAEYVRTYLLDQDDQYLQDNYDAIRDIFQFDGQFPDFSEDITENSFLIREYLEDRFPTLRSGNKALAASRALSSSLGIYPEDTSSLIGGDLDFSLRMYGGAVRNGFAWNIGMGLVYDGADSILSSISFEDRRYGSDLYFTLGGDLGYGAYIGDSFAIGLSFSPDFIFSTTISNTDLVTSRIDGSLLGLFANNAFDFGLGLDLNIGFMIDAGEAKILMDFRNIPSISMNWYFNATDVLMGFNLITDENIYFVPPDAAIGFIYDHGRWHLKGEISNIMDQFIWSSMVPVYKFDILSVPKFSVSYDILSDLSIGLGYEYRSVILSFMWSGLKAEFRAKLDRVGFGVSVGYEF